MVSRNEIVNYLDEELDVEHFNGVEEAKFNGLLVEGSGEVERIGLCTNFTYENIESAAEQDLGLVISHHGGWEEFDGDLLEEKKEEARENGLNWYVAHEPLDCADGYGVSVALAEKLGIDVEDSYAEHAGGDVGRYGHLQVSGDEFLERLEEIEPGHEVVGGLEDLEEKKFGVVGGSGAALREIIDDTHEEGCDVMVTGNAAFFGKYHAKELGLTLVLMEETSSEKWGVYALGEHLKEQFPEVELSRLEETNW